MSLLQAIYPFVLAILNMTLGWILYYPFGSVAGILLVAIGTVVLLTRIGGTVREHRLRHGKSE
jgi:putative Mn2+ efflux pump MntP